MLRVPCLASPLPPATEADTCLREEAHPRHCRVQELPSRWQEDPLAQCRKVSMVRRSAVRLGRYEVHVRADVVGTALVFPSPTTRSVSLSASTSRSPPRSTASRSCAPTPPPPSTTTRATLNLLSRWVILSSGAGEACGGGLRASSVGSSRPGVNSPSPRARLVIAQRTALTPAPNLCCAQC